MENRLDILNLINEKNIVEKQLASLVFGALELRELNSKRYIYVHTRLNGISRTNYVGEYDQAVYDKIVENNLFAKQLKRQLRAINKKLVSLGYVEKDVDVKVALNIDFAKRNLVDTIYKQAVLEGVAVTFLDTETIIEGGKIRNVSADDVQKINNLKHAWQFVLDKDVITSPSDYYLLRTINQLVEEGFYYNAGQMRSVPVSIGGTKWKPQLPIESIVKEELTQILAIDDIFQKAIEALLFVMKKQLFIDGNKRTAVIFANHILISNGAGLVVIPDEQVSKYKQLLIDYYETDNSSKIKSFIESACLTKLKS